MVVAHSSVCRGSCIRSPWGRGSGSSSSVHTRLLLLQFRLHILLGNRHSWLWRTVYKGWRRLHRGGSTGRNAILLRCIRTHRDVVHASIWVKCRRLLLLWRWLRDSLVVIRLDWNECARGWVVNEMLISRSDILLRSWLMRLLWLRWRGLLLQLLLLLLV